MPLSELPSILKPAGAAGIVPYTPCENGQDDNIDANVDRRVAYSAFRVIHVPERAAVSK